MHNTYLLTLVMMLTAVSASAQFYTITKETEISGIETLNKDEAPEIKEDTIEHSDSIVSPPQKIENKENLGLTILNARKSDDYKSSRVSSSGVVVTPINNDTSSRHSTALDDTCSLPELTIPNLIAEIKKNNIKYPKIVLAQAILETGWFKSSVCRIKNNLFGLTNPRTGKYYEFNHWTESVKAYYDKVQYRYYQKNKKIKSEVDYLIWLRDLPYAEDNNYIQSLIKVIKQLSTY